LIFFNILPSWTTSKDGLKNLTYIKDNKDLTLAFGGQFFAAKGDQGHWHFQIIGFCIRLHKNGKHLILFFILVNKQLTLLNR